MVLPLRWTDHKITSLSRLGCAIWHSNWRSGSREWRLWPACVARGAGYQLLGAAAVGNVIHPAADGDDAGVTGGGKGIDHGLRLGNGGGARGESPIDDLDLVGVNGELGGEAVAHRRGAFGAEAVVVAKVEIDRVDRLDAGGPRPEKAQGPGRTGGVGQPARAAAAWGRSRAPSTGF